MKKSNRELVREERRRLRRVDKPKSRTSGFTIWGRILFILTPLSIAALLLASYFTPLFAIERFEVSGNERIDSAEVSAALVSLKGRPLTTVTEAEISELLADFSLIETFALQSEPPNTLRLKIRERQPIGILVRSGKNFLYDAAGVEIAETSELGAYPFVVFDGDPITDNRYRVAMELLLSLPIETYAQVFSVEVSQQLTSKLVLRTQNISVIWGSNEESLLKAEVLDSLIATGLEDGVTIDVSSPTSPVVRFPD